MTLWGGLRRYYARLGWPLTGEPPRLAAGVRFDALRLPAAAGLPLVARRPGGAAAGAGGAPLLGPALRAGGTVWVLLAEGAAAEVPGLLEWLEWGALADELGLAPVGAGGSLPAPAPPGTPGGGPREAAVWLRPPVPGREGERALPALVLGGRRPPGPAPDLVRLVDTAAAECHRARLRRVRATAAAAAAATRADQALAFS
ncbi:SCO3374 family protein [Streptomyces sp. JJ36]|uniref:SCO3374 family protein n=1 Tax=Streptomyces sp. JJ36 TaxID=2736645 RepID=UPI001F3CF0A3|nr:SCO3374 family protein [Streptomyces sp. JJ36]